MVVVWVQGESPKNDDEASDEAKLRWQNILY